MNITNMDLTQLIGKPIGAEYDLFLTNDSIEEGCDYNNFIVFSRNLSPHDIVNLHISCSGGRSSTSAIICQAIENSQATFIAHLNSLCWSAATFIALSCDGWVVGDLVEFGIHTVQGGTGYTELPKIQYRTNALLEYNDRLFNKYYAKNFLTNEEIDNVKSGAEITLFKEDLEVRLQQYADERGDKSGGSPSSDKPLSQEDLQELTDEDLEYDLKEIDNVRKVYLSEIKKRKTKK